MPHKSFRDWFPLFASVVSFIASIIIPIINFAVTPTPFAATVHYEALSLPSVITKSWPFPASMKGGTKGPPKTVPATFEPPQEVLVVTVSNVGTSVRHNVNMTVENLLTFAGIELGPLNQSTAVAKTWRTPKFQEESGKLLLPSISELPAGTAFQVFIWGHYKVFGPQVELRSDEGLGSVVTQYKISGWPLLLALNAWWIVMVLCVGAGIWFLKRFNERQASC
jgi:hypothetical protein